MPKYFSYFPEISYNGKVVKDITRNARILDSVESNPYSYLPYTIKDEERAEDIAQHYYGDINLVWLVYYSNKIVDPYFEWPVSFQNFERTLVKKYKVQAEKSEGTTLKDSEVLNWTQKTTTNDNILYYYDEDDNRVSKDTIINSAIPTSGWTAMRIYDKELADNEAKRNIQLLNRVYTDIAVENLKKVINV